MPAESQDHPRIDGAATEAKFNLEDYLRRFAAHDELALYRLMTLVENRMPESSAIIERIYRAGPDARTWSESPGRRAPENRRWSIG